MNLYESLYKNLDINLTIERQEKLKILNQR